MLYRITWDRKTIINFEKHKLWNDAVMIYFKVLFRNSLQHTGTITESHSQERVDQLIFNSSIFRLQVSSNVFNFIFLNW